MSLMFVEGPAAARDHILITIIINLAQHCSNTVVGKVSVKHERLAEISTLDRTALSGELLTQLLESLLMLGCPSPWHIVLEEAVQRGSNLTKLGHVATIVVEKP